MNREHCVFYGSRLTQLRSRSTHANITPIFSFVQLCSVGYLAQLAQFYTIQQISVFQYSCCICIISKAHVVPFEHNCAFKYQRPFLGNMLWPGKLLMYGSSLIVFCRCVFSSHLWASNEERHKASKHLLWLFFFFLDG